MTSFPLPQSQTLSGLSPKPQTNPDWHVLVLFSDDTESTVKGFWGPYSTFDIAVSAMEELRQWPIDGYWDIRRLNRFVALKLPGAGTDAYSHWTWQTTTGNA